MKLLAVLSTAAVASAQWPAPGFPAPAGVGPALITHPNGAVTPSEEPAVLAARADHFAAKGHALNAAIASGPGLPIAPVAAATPLVAPIAPLAPAPLGPRPYVGPLAGVPHLVAHPNGAVTPAEEPANLAARADHFAAKGLPLGPLGVGPLGLVAHPNGALTPAEEPAVLAARRDHLAHFA